MGFLLLSSVVLEPGVDQTDIETIAAWIESVFDGQYPVIIAPVNARAPAEEYLTVQELTSVSVGYPSQAVEEYDDDWADVHAEEDEESTYTVNAFSPNGKRLLQAIHNAMMHEDLDAGFEMVGRAGIRYLPWHNSSGFSPRYVCDFTFRDSYETIRRVRRVLTTVVEGEFDGMESGFTDVEDEE